MADRKVSLKKRVLEGINRKLHSLNCYKDKYVVLRGRDSNNREELVRELGLELKIPVYSEEQFPNTGGKIVINLEEYV